MLPLRFRINHATVPTSEAHVRVTSAVNMMLSIPGATVTSFEFTPEGGRSGRASGPRVRPALSVWLQGHGHLFSPQRAGGGHLDLARASCCCRLKSAGWTVGPAFGGRVVSTKSALSGPKWPETGRETRVKSGLPANPTSGVNAGQDVFSESQRGSTRGEGLRFAMRRLGVRIPPAGSVNGSRRRSLG